MEQAHSTPCATLTFDSKTAYHQFLNDAGDMSRLCTREKNLSSIMFKHATAKCRGVWEYAMIQTVAYAACCLHAQPQCLEIRGWNGRVAFDATSKRLEENGLKKSLKGEKLLCQLRKLPDINEVDSVHRGKYPRATNSTSSISCENERKTFWVSWNESFFAFYRGFSAHEPCTSTPLCKKTDSSSLLLSQGNSRHNRKASRMRTTEEYKWYSWCFVMLLPLRFFTLCSTFWKIRNILTNNVFRVCLQGQAAIRMNLPFILRVHNSANVDDVDFQES